MLDRRHIIKGAGGLAAALTSGYLGARRAVAESVTLPFDNGERPLVAYPQKRPLIRLTERPPQLETPFSVFDEGAITSNDAFFVRYHLGDIPLSIDTDTFRLEVGGKVDSPLSLSLRDIKATTPTEIVAVNQCSGNSRGLFNPRMGGGQLANGAMGNARWVGVSLKSVLDKAGVRPEAKQVVFDGLDKPVMPQTPDFAKALDIDHARDGEVMLAWSMNGSDLPWLNGYPLRVVVPGYYGTYWVKHVNKINVIDEVLENFWMKTAYRIPDNSCACVPPGTKPDKTVPIGRFNVRSFITNVQDGATVRASTDTLLRGMAFDGGSGIKEVAISSDGGKTWSAAELGEDLGKYSFRTWHTNVKLPAGSHDLLVRATSRSGEVQPMEQRWNPSGYMRNVVESVRVQAA
ncbi:molybdopterin-dependent oxidoreductase [Hyphomicrobium sp. ghe19]|uniref:SorA family sulfite dehydrogenase catalytic subunit n=1 Tax=Hyphomicrobium sp. ghe19 TaxID=2682968 RepID=UPI0013668928|nr:Protein-methionine-sulfoxide reductase catalytic subunit MsrP [Hyphomicrobium sp. ghe19]